jgi:hypothetical protein
LGIDEHVRTLGGLMVVLAAIAALVAIIGMVMFGSPFSLIAQATQAGTTQSIELPLLRIYGALLILLGLILSAPLAICGLALRQYRSWARDGTMIVCALLLAMFPHGTMLAVYGFWVVLSPEIEPLFSPRER